MVQSSFVRRSIAASGLLACAMSVYALPALQLTILDGNYVGGSDETTYASGNPFTLYALMQPSGSNTISDTYRISAAITPQAGPGAVNYGSFKFDGTTVSVSGDMVYGVAPIDTFSQAADPGDLPTHSIFPTFFREFAFQFDANKTTTAFDAQTTTPTSALTDTNCNITDNGCMYFASFTIDVANLTSGNVHLDLYNTSICTGSQGQCDGGTDIDINKFAPFSHDAQSSGGSTSSSSGLASSSGDIPEPNSSALALLGLGLVAVGFRLRRKALQA